MANFLPFPNTLGGSTDQSKKDGVILTKWNADNAYWHASAKGVHVCGSPHNRPILVSKEGDSPHVAPLGLSVPIEMPEVQLFSGGSIDGPCQIGVRKFNTKTGCPSDFSAIWPPAGIETEVPLPDAGDRGTINLNRSADSPVNTKIAQKFTVPSSVPTATGGNSSAPVPVTSRLTYQSVTVRLKLVGTPAASDSVKVQFFPVGGSGNPSEPAAETFPVLCSDISTDTWGGDVTFLLPEFMILSPAQEMFIVLEPTYSGSAGYIQAIIDTDSTYGGNNDIKVEQSAAWVNYSDANADVIFSLNPAESSRGHFNYADLTGLSYVIGNMDDYALDAVYEDYDALQVVMASTLTGGEWKVMRTVPINTTTPSATDPDFAFNQPVATSAALFQSSVLPYFNRAWGGVEQMISFSEGEQQRLVAFGRPGWDNYVDAPIVARGAIYDMMRGDFISAGLDPTLEIDAWVLGFWDNQAGEWLNGTSIPDGDPQWDGYLITIFNSGGQEAGGNEVMRGILRWNATNEVYYLETARGKQKTYTDSNLRFELRRQIAANVVGGSSEVTLTYVDDDSPAYIADQWMVGHTMTVEGLSSNRTPVVIKCKKLSTANPVPYCSKKYFPSNILYLEEVWLGEGGSGQFGLKADRSQIMFGGGRFDEFQGTSPKLWLQLDNTRPITGLGICNGILCALTAGTELYKFAVGNIVTPATLEALAGYAITQDVGVGRFFYNYTCINWPGIVTDQKGQLYCIGGEAIYQYDGNEIKAISSNSIFDRYASYGPQTKVWARAVLDPGSRFEPTIRFGGLHIGDEYRVRDWQTTVYADGYRSDGMGSPIGQFWGQFTFTWKDFRWRRDVQLVWLTERNGWINYDKQMSMDSACTALDNTGRYRVLVGGDNRLWLYGYPLQDGSADDENCFTIGKIDGQEAYLEGVDAGQFTDEEPYTFHFDFTSSPGFPKGAAYLWTARSGLRLYKIASDGSWEKAEVLFATFSDEDGMDLLLKPETGWTVTEGATYDVILGAIEWGITLPALVPDNLAGSVDWRGFKLSIYDNNGENPFTWVLQVHPFISANGGGSSNLTPQGIYNYTRADFQENRFTHLFMLDEPSYEFFPRFFGLAPPDSHLTFERLGIEYWQHGT